MKYTYLLYASMILSVPLRAQDTSPSTAIAPEDVLSIVDTEDQRPRILVQEPAQEVMVQHDTAELELLDTIRAVVYTADGIDIITVSMLERPSLDGRSKSLEDLIDEYLIYRDGATKTTIGDDAADAYIAQFKKQNNLTDEQINELFERAGYSVAEGRQEFKRLQMIAQMLDHNVMGKVRIVPEADIQRYYDEHPVYEEAVYTLEYAQVPAQAVHNGKVRQRTQIEWSELPPIKESELASHMHFVTKMPKGAVSRGRQLENGNYEMFRLKDKIERRLVPLEQRRREIVDVLRRPRYEQLLKEYKEQLRSGAHIVYFDESKDKQLAQLAK